MTDKKQVADAAVIVANSLAGISWVAELELVLRILLSIVGLISALVAIRYHLRNTPPRRDD